MSLRSERIPSKNMTSWSLKMELEEDDRINAGATPLGVELGDPLAHEAQVERGFQVAIEVILRNEVLEGDGNRFVEAAGLGGTEHKAFPNVSRAAPVARPGR